MAAQRVQIHLVNDIVSVEKTNDTLNMEVMVLVFIDSLRRFCADAVAPQLTQIATTCHLNLFTAIYCYCIRVRSIRTRTNYLNNVRSQFPVIYEMTLKKIEANTNLGYFPLSHCDSFTVGELILPAVICARCPPFRAHYSLKWLCVLKCFGGINCCHISSYRANDVDISHNTHSHIAAMSSLKFKPIIRQNFRQQCASRPTLTRC